jgi:hypothetical protein
MSLRTWLTALTLGGSTAAAAFGAGCSEDGIDPTASPSVEAAAYRTCDPLAVDAAPIALAEIVGAGRAPDGTVYVIDRGPLGIGTGLRAFVSDGATLRRRKVLGSGEGPDFVIATIGDDAANPLQARIELTGGKAARMGVFRGPPDPKTKSFELGVQGDELTLLGAGELATFSVVNLAEIDVMYDATTPDGHRLVIFTPVIDYTDDEVRLFYGTDDDLAERRIHFISRDSSIHVTFDLDGVTTTAHLVSRLSGGMWGPPRLQPEGGGPSTPLTPVPGSPGTDWNESQASLDAGGDAATPAQSPREDAATLVARLHFRCL